MFDPKREPDDQNAQLEMLYQLSTERNYDIVIVDDANMKYKQIVTELLVIENEKNSVELITFKALPPYIQLDCTKRNGHLMKFERLINIKSTFYETLDKLKHLSLTGVTIHAPYSCDIHEDYDALCNSNMETALDEIKSKSNNAVKDHTVYSITSVVLN